MSGLRTRVEARVLEVLLGLPERVQRLLLRRPVEVEGQVLAAETQLMLRLKELLREPAVEELPIDQARPALVRQAELVSSRQHVGAIRDLLVDGAEGSLP